MENELKDNFKINEIKNINNNENNDKTFNQLLNLQLLVQKHSGLKEICKNKIPI